LLGYCRSLTPDLSDVDREMICEQAVEIAVRKIDVYDPGLGTFPGWLRGFVRNTVKNWRRAEGQRHPDHVEDLVLTAGPPLAPVATPQTQAAAAALKKAVRALPEPDQVYLNLRYQQGLPTKQIAQLLGKSDAAVRQRLSRIQRHLKVTVDA
jgi:RNA polymerase sigma factor (sigma-70 family)